MKKDLFWKIMAVLFFIWLCLWLWSSLIVVSTYGGTVPVKVNKLTGKGEIVIIE
ncbi:MAG: hypothetical protein ACFFDS_02730 [Candidatus Thorarchaeota archaeon]